MYSVDIALILKLRAIRNCQKILEEHLQSSEVERYLIDNQSEREEDLASGLIPTIKYDIKVYQLRVLSIESVRMEIMEEEK